MAKAPNPSVAADRGLVCRIRVGCPRRPRLLNSMLGFGARGLGGFQLGAMAVTSVGRGADRALAMRLGHGSAGAGVSNRSLLAASCRVGRAGGSCGRNLGPLARLPERFPGAAPGWQQRLTRSLQWTGGLDCC